MVEPLVVHERLAVESQVRLVPAGAVVALRAERTGWQDAFGAWSSCGAGGWWLVGVVVHGTLGVGKEADFTKDAGIPA